MFRNMKHRLEYHRLEDNFLKSITVEPPVRNHPKCQALVVAYESLNHIESKFCLINIRQLKRLA